MYRRVPAKSNKQKKILKKLFFVAILKVTDEKIMNRIRYSEVGIRRYKSVGTKK